MEFMELANIKFLKTTKEENKREIKIKNKKKSLPKQTRGR